MNNDLKKYFFLLCLLILIGINYSFSQQINPRANGANKSANKWDRRFGEVKYNDKVYLQGSNWFSFGLGPGLHIGPNTKNQSFAMAYHHRFRPIYFNIGWHYTTPELIGFKPIRILHQMEFLNDIHSGVGLRTEGRWHHISFFIGPSWALSLIPNSESENASTFHNALGAYVEVEIMFKYFYDMGFGVNLFGSFNKYYQIAGLQVSFYFSNAFINNFGK